MSSDPWWWDAACSGMAPLFDAADDRPGRGHARTAVVRALDAGRYEQAAAVCATCPVTRQCSADAQVGRDEGVRAGRAMPTVNWKTRKQGRAA